MQLGSRTTQGLATFFDVMVCHHNAESWRDLEPRLIYRIHDNKISGVLRKVIDIELGPHYTWRNKKRLLEVPSSISTAYCH